MPGRRERATALAGEGSIEKKRGRKDDASASSSGVEDKWKKGELLEIRSRSHSCYICGNKFQSLKAVFGHTRTHRFEDVLVQGALPLLIYFPEEWRGVKEQLAPTLLNIAQEVLQGPCGGGFFWP